MISHEDKLIGLADRLRKIQIPIRWYWEREEITHLEKVLKEIRHTMKSSGKWQFGALDLLIKNFLNQTLAHNETYKEPEKQQIFSGMVNKDILRISQWLNDVLVDIQDWDYALAKFPILAKEFNLDKMLDTYPLVRETLIEYLFALGTKGKSQDIQKEMVFKLVQQINSSTKGGHDHWAISFEIGIYYASLNCSGCASFLGLLLFAIRNQSGIQNITYAIPLGHAVNFTYFQDGSIFFSDSRNGIFEEITHNINGRVPFGQIQLCTIVPGQRQVYKFIVEMNLIEGLTIAYAGNVKSLLEEASQKLDGVGNEESQSLNDAKNIVRKFNIDSSYASMILQSVNSIARDYESFEQSSYGKAAEEEYEATHNSLSGQVQPMMRAVASSIKKNPGSQVFIFSKINDILGYLLHKSDDLPTGLDPEILEAVKDFRNQTQTLFLQDRNDYETKLKALISHALKLAG